MFRIVCQMLSTFGILVPKSLVIGTKNSSETSPERRRCGATILVTASGAFWAKTTARLTGVATAAALVKYGVALH